MNTVLNINEYSMVYLDSSNYNDCDRPTAIALSPDDTKLTIWGQDGDNPGVL